MNSHPKKHYASVSLTLQKCVNIWKLLQKSTCKNNEIEKVVTVVVINVLVAIIIIILLVLVVVMVITTIVSVVIDSRK